MRRNGKITVLVLFSLLFVMLFAQAAWAETVEGNGAPDKAVLMSVSGSDEHSDGTGVHQDPATFQKNYCLSVDQKTYAISEIDRVVSRIIKPEMSDLEKYYTLALWEYKRVKYDNDFWSGHYNFDYYSHQWDAYGALKEKSVCAGMAIFYANLCHAADLPCKFVRLGKGSVDHTINYIPNINGNAYYVDVTEDCFLMSEKSCSFADGVDKEFSHLTKECTDYTFDYPSDSLIISTPITECLGGTYNDWFKENALHEAVTEKAFMGQYQEKGSGTAGIHYASYHDYEAQCFSGFHQNPGIWFLEDFYEDPEAVSTKILNKEFDEQLLSISGIKDGYDSENEFELAQCVADDIIVRYFPSCENGKVVPWEDNLKTNKDYTVTFDSYDEEKGEAVLSLEADGKYTGSTQIRVKWTPKKLIDDARILAGVQSGYSAEELVPEVVYLGEPLEEGVDYTWEKVNQDDTFDKPGDYEVKLIGQGNYKGTDTKTFHIVLEEDEAEEAVEEAKKEVASAQAAIAALDENAQSADMVAALKQFATAQQSLNDAQDALARTRAILSKEKQTELEEENAKLQQQIDDLTEDLQQQIDDLNDQLEEAQTIDITMYPYTITLPKTSYPYTGKAIKPAVTVVGLDADYYTVSYSNNTKIGTATVTVTATSSPYTGSISKTFKITKRANTLAVKGKTATVKYKALKKKTQYLGVAMVIKVTNKGQGTRSYVKVSGNKKITINKKTGKVTVKKGLKKGTYTVKVKVKAAGKGTYKESAWKYVTIKIRVK